MLMSLSTYKLAHDTIRHGIHLHGTHACSLTCIFPTKQIKYIWTVIWVMYSVQNNWWHHLSSTYGHHFHCALSAPCGERWYCSLRLYPLIPYLLYCSFHITVRLILLMDPFCSLHILLWPKINRAMIIHSSFCPVFKSLLTLPWKLLWNGWAELL